MAIKFLGLTGLKYFWEQIKTEFNKTNSQIDDTKTQISATNSELTTIRNHLNTSNTNFGKRIEALENIADLTGNIQFDFEIGAITSSTGANAASTKRIRSTNFVPNIGSKIMLEIVGDVKVFAVYYDSEYSVSGNSGWRDETSILNIDSNSNVSYVKVFAGYTSDTDVTSIDDLSSKFSLRYFADAMKYNGYVLSNGRTSFSECSENGYYTFTLASVSDITDAPEGLTNGGVIRVENFAASSVRFQTITIASGKTYFRYNDNEFKDISPSAAIGSGAKWYALGDSITQGYYSYVSEEISNPTIAITAENWVNTVATAKNYVLTNYGVGGSGFVHNGTVLDKLNARDHVNTIDFSNADIVTLAYGVNDWKYNCNLGTFDDDVQTGGTIYSNMRYVIEKILNDNPLCKIIIITPINCSAYGVKENNWGIGYSFSNNGTLEDIFNAEKTVANYYGLELIDMTHNSVVNRENAPNILIDGVHPSIEGHKIMGKEIADKIHFW